MAQADSLGAGVKRMNLSLPDLPPGWYEVALLMQSQGQFVGEQTIDIIRLADDIDHIAPDPRFGIDAHVATCFTSAGDVHGILPVYSPFS